MSVGVRSVDFIHPDGLRLHRRVYDAQSGGTRRRPVVCIPGLTRNARDFEALAPRLAQAGHEVHALDLRGRGLSDRDPDPSRYALAVYAEDALEFLDREGLSEPVVVGVSLGGLIAMRTAAMRPGLWAGAVLDDIGPRVAAPGVARLQAYVGVEPMRFDDWSVAAAAVARINALAFPHFDAGDWMRMARRQCREVEGRAVVFDYDAAIGDNVRAVSAEEAAAADLTADFEALARRPTLVVRGETSDILSREVYEAMIARPQVEGLEIAGVGHAPTLDEPEVVAAILGFLDRLEAWSAIRPE